MMVDGCEWGGFIIQFLLEAITFHELENPLLPTGKLLQFAMENRHVFWVNPLFLWPLSVANC